MPPQPVPPAPTVDYGTAYNELGSTYDPQAAQINTAIAAVPGQRDQALSSLDQAKANAFRDIGVTANSRGLLNSGYSPYEQNDYTVNKYNPAALSVNQKASANVQSLQDKLTDLNNKRATDAENLVLQTQQDQAAAAQAATAAARLSSGSSGSSKTPASQYKLAGKAGATNFSQGYKFSGPNGVPISLAQYVGGTGGDANTVLDLLKNGSAYDKKIYNDVNIMLTNKKIGTDPNSILSAIARQDGSNYYGLR